jgi:hypothetical protein
MVNMVVIFPYLSVWKGGKVESGNEQKINEQIKVEVATQIYLGWSGNKDQTNIKRFDVDSSLFSPFIGL